MSQEGNALDVLQQLVNRPLLTPTELLKELHRADWPDYCYVHAADFLALAPYFAMARDVDGLYFQLANAQIRPKSDGTGSHLDLSNYTGPDRVVLARPIDPSVAEWGK